MMVQTRTRAEVFLTARRKKNQSMRAFGLLVRDRRVKLGWSIKKAADYAGLNWNSWNSVEKGTVTSILAVFKAAEAMDLELFWEVEEAEG